MQTLPAQLPRWQSVLAVQRFPSAHRAQPTSAPPQSRSVSVPSVTPSAHCGVVAQAPLRQIAVAQSLVVLQAVPTGHPEHVPPQSTPSSVPSCRPSSQEGALHDFAAEQSRPVAQSLSAAQAAPAPQPGHSPPQSTAVSLWFSTWSEQLAAAHVPALQCLDAQSSFTAQFWPAAQRAAHPPPQSMSPSVPLRMPSLQLAGAPFVGQLGPGQSSRLHVVRPSASAQLWQMPPIHWAGATQS